MPMGMATAGTGVVTERAPDPPIERIRLETATNHEAFTRLRDGFAQHEGEYALMKSGMVVDFFTNRRSALLAGQERFLDRLFSVHRVLPHDRRHSGGMAPADERRQGAL